MRLIDADRLAVDAMIVRETTSDFIDLIQGQPTVENESLDGYEPVIHAIWEYYTNDEGKARWRCSHCRKICHKHPHDKKRCSVCGAHMRMEG